MESPPTLQDRHTHQRRENARNQHDAQPTHSQVKLACTTPFCDPGWIRLLSGLRSGIGWTCAGPQRPLSGQAERQLSLAHPCGELRGAVSRLGCSICAGSTQLRGGASILGRLPVNPNIVYLRMPSDIRRPPVPPARQCPTVPDLVLAHLPLEAAGLHLTAALLGTILGNLLNQGATKVPVTPRWGESAGVLKPAPDHLYRVSEREAVRVLVGRQRRLVQKAAHRKVGQHQAFDLLLHQRGRLGAQDGVATEDVCVERHFI